MRIVSWVAFLVLFCGLASPRVSAQEGAPVVPAAALTQNAAVEKASGAWQAALRKTPNLVSLKVEIAADASTRERLERRLKLLGSKTFSNREWRGYWQSQVETVAPLLAALETAEGPESVRSALADWRALAADKVKNQDRYFNAIEAERDAIEERLEALMDAPSAAAAVIPGTSDTPSPYEKRRLHLADLDRQIEWQKGKRTSATVEIQFLERQLDVEKTLFEALAKDVDLARREHEISNEQAGSPILAWAALWSGVAKANAGKVEKIASEAALGAARQREREVELGLAQSQLGFRNERLEALETQLVTDSQLSGWVEATGETFASWLKDRSWRIAIGLFLIWVGLKLALRVVGKVAEVILAQAESEATDSTDNEERTKTLATVFSGIARIALTVVAALLALEQIGVNTGPILGSVAILGLAVSFGSQNLVRDVVNGFFILLENQFAVGDVVTIGGKTGTVETITIRSTWIRQGTGDLHVIPNGSVSLVSNLTRDWSRAQCHIGVSYEADLAQVQTVTNAIGEQMFAEPEWNDDLQEAPAWVGVTALGDSAVTIRVQAKVRPGSQWAVTRELNRRLKIGYDAAGIEIPFPQRVVHTKSA